MDFTLNNQADTATVQPISAPAINTSQLRTFDFSAVDAFRVDSSRIVRKPAAPIVKTIPYVPENDTISHPEYDVLTGEFVITHDSSIESQLRINPITPSDENATSEITAAEQQQISVPVLQVVETNADTVKEEVPSPVRTQNILVEAEENSLQQASTNDTASEVLADTVPFATDTTSADTVLTLVQPSVPKIFEEREGKPMSRKIGNFSVDRTITDTDWMIGTVIVSFVLFIWVRMIYGKFIAMVMQTSVSSYAAHRVYDESNAVRGRGFFLLNTIFYINASLFICQALDFYNIEVREFSGIMNFVLCAAGVISYFTLRTIVLKILDFIFDTNAFGEYNFTIYIFNKVYGLIMMPVVAVIPFVPDFVAEKLIWVGLALYAISYLMRLFRGLQICVKNRFSIFYLFFYFCALEILPIAVVCKIVISYCL